MVTIYKPLLLFLGFLTLPFSLPFPSFPAQRSFPPSPTPPTYAYNMPIHLLYVGLYCTISIYTGFATRDDAYDVMLGKGKVNGV